MIDLFAQFSMKLDMISSPVVEIQAGQSANIDVNFTEQRHITGAEYFREGENFADQVTFQVIHPVSGVVDQFCTDIYIKSYGQYTFYKATIPAGLTVRVVYKNNGQSPVKFCFNLICHKDKE